MLTINSFSLSLSLSPYFFTDAQRNAVAQQKLILQQHENEMVLKVLSERLEKGRKEATTTVENDLERPLLSPLSFSQPRPLPLSLFSTQNKQTNKQELQSLDPDDGVFKLIGPALVKQEPDEAVQAVQTRLSFIGGELARLEEGGKKIGTDADACQARCADLQQQAIRESTTAADGAGGGGVAAGGGAQAQPAS